MNDVIKLLIILLLTPIGGSIIQIVLSLICYIVIIITAYTYKRHSDASELFNFSKHNNKILELDIDKIIEKVLNNPYELNLFIGSLYFVSEVRPKILSLLEAN